MNSLDSRSKNQFTKSATWTGIAVVVLVEVAIVIFVIIKELTK